MARYLLGTNCLLDIALQNQGAANRWFAGKAPQPGLFVGDVAISAFSVAAIRAFYRATPPTTPKGRVHEENVSKLIRQFEVVDAIEGVSPPAVSFWETHS